MPHAELDRLAEREFDWVWCLSVWQRGAAGPQVARSNHEWRREFQETLPDLQVSQREKPGNQLPQGVQHGFDP